MGAFADVLVLLLMLCIKQRTVEFLRHDMQKFSIDIDSNYNCVYNTIEKMEQNMQKFSIEVTELEIKRDYYLSCLKSRSL